MSKLVLQRVVLAKGFAGRDGETLFSLAVVGGQFWCQNPANAPLGELEEVTCDCEVRSGGFKPTLITAFKGSGAVKAPAAAR